MAGRKLTASSVISVRPINHLCINKGSTYISAPGNLCETTALTQHQHLPEPKSTVSFPQLWEWYGMTAMSTTTHADEAVLQVHQLTSSASDDEVRAVMALSAHVFRDVPSNPETHISFPYWRQRLSEAGASIVFVSRSGQSEKPLGFFFSFPKTQEQIGFETLHIWLAGVSDEARGLGIFPMLLERTKEHGRALQYGYLSVTTIPSRFEKMYRILQANGWESVGWIDSMFGQAVRMKLKL